jgi:aspartate racemase
LRSISRDGDLPLSFAQERVWFLDQLEPGTPAYNIRSAIRLTGSLNVAALEHSLNEVVRRHEVLRTSFPAINGLPRQHIAPARRVTLPVVDLRELPEPEREAETQRLTKQAGQRSFDLARGPLWQMILLRVADEEHGLLFTIHHIVFDEWSRGIFFRELWALYAANVNKEPSPLPELAIQYVDYAAWQRQWLRGEVLENEVAYWKQQLAGAPVLELPTDRPRPPVQTFRGARQPLGLSPRLSDGLKTLGRREGVTLFMTLLAAFQTLLYRYTGQDDISVGTFVANRDQVETENVIGFFVNNLVLRTDLSGNPGFRELLARVREVTLGAYAHQDVPFEKLLEELQPRRDLSRTPLFQVMLVLQNAPRSGQALPSLTARRSQRGGGGRANFDLTLWVAETSERLTATLEYNSDLFDAATISRMLGHFERLLEEIVANPDQRLLDIPLLEEEHQRDVEMTSGLPIADQFVFDF